MLSCENNCNKHGSEYIMNNGAESTSPVVAATDAAAHPTPKTYPAANHLEVINHLNQIKQVKCEYKKSNISYDVHIINETVTPQQICFIMTVHDLGEDSLQFDKLIHDEKMEGIRNRVIWLNVNLPGQEPESPDLESKKYPSLEELGEGLVSVLNELKIPQVVCMGQGAGANIAFHFATKHAARCLGLVLIEPIGSSAGFMESIRHMFGARGKSISGESGGVSAEHRAINEHRNSAGSILTRFDKQTRNSQGQDTFNMELLDASKLAEHRNSKNLALFADAFFNRSCLTDKINDLKADALIACGKNSTSYAESKKLYKAFQENNRKTPLRMVNSPFLELDNISSVLSESPERLAVSLQYFLQGIGLLSAMPLRSSLRSSSISSGPPTSPSPPPISSSPATTNANLIRSTSIEDENNANQAHSGSSAVSSSNSESNSQSNLNNRE